MNLFGNIEKIFFDVWTWFKERAHGRYAKAWLAGVAFLEAWFPFIPPETLLVAIQLAGVRRWVLYASITTIASVLGGIFGYIIGSFFFDLIGIHIISFLNAEDIFVGTKEVFAATAFLVIFMAAFTPLPFAPIVLAAGFFSVNLIVFIVASLIGRSLRYFIIAFITHSFGEKALFVFSRYISIIAILFVLLFIAWILIYFNVINIPFVAMTSYT